MGARGQAEQAVTEMEAEGTGGTEVDRGDDRVAQSEDRWRPNEGTT